MDRILNFLERAQDQLSENIYFHHPQTETETYPTLKLDNEATKATLHIYRK